jgi:hypothetical protein
MIAYLAQTGTLCFGPMDGTEQLLVLVDEWVQHPRRLERDEALGELALRYFRSHGPATAKDLARWGHLTAADVRTGMAVARPELARLEVDGVEHLLDPRTPELLAAHRSEARGLFLLPGFDELVLGYQDRTAVVPAEFAAAIVPGGNGVFRATVVADGTAVGTWQHTGKATAGGSARRRSPRSPQRSSRRSPRCTARCRAELPALTPPRARGQGGTMITADAVLEHCLTLPGAGRTSRGRATSSPRSPTRSSRHR